MERNWEKVVLRIDLLFKVLYNIYVVKKFTTYKQTKLKVDWCQNSNEAGVRVPKQLGSIPICAGAIWLSNFNRLSE